MVKFPFTLNSYLVGLVDRQCTDISRSIGKVLVKVLAILSKKSIGGSIGNTFLTKYRYRYWQYFLKVLFTTLVNRLLFQLIQII